MYLENILIQIVIRMFNLIKVNESMINIFIICILNVAYESGKK